MSKQSSEEKDIEKETSTEKEDDKKSKKESKVEEITITKEEYNDLKNEVSSLEDKLIRTKAEMVNFRRRMEEEHAKLQKYANENLMKELLEVVDNFERAISMDDDNLEDEVSKFLEGFKMIYGELNQILIEFDVKEIEALGKEFDSKYHNAVAKDQNKEKESGVVIEVYQKGYMLKDKVIRPAMVKVNE